MKKKLLLMGFLLLSFMTKAQQIIVTPASFNADEEIVLTFSGIDVASNWGTTDVYLWAWYYDLNDEEKGNSPFTGTNWVSSPETAKWTNNGDGTYSFTLTPTAFFADNNIGKVGFIAKTQNGSSQTDDFYFEVGIFQVSLTAPSQEVSIVTAGTSFAVQASSGVATDFELFANGNSVNTQQVVSNYSYNYVVNENTEFRLVATETGTTNEIINTFSAYINPSPTEASVPAGLQNGFNFDPSNPNEATFVLYAPDKDFVHLIGNFNNNDWSIDNTYLLNKDSATDRFWITIDLSANTATDLLYQYAVEYDTKIADPYSTLLLDPYNDQYLEDTVFPDIPDYPNGKTTEMVSWVQLDETNYDWQVTNFDPPAKEDLVIYEILLRDFDNGHRFQDVIDRLDYLEELGINAIELMPVQEFDGNLSWGYNPAFHMALDKYYGTRNALKSLVDACHARDIAVILDVVYNHASGQNSNFRMYNTSNGGTGGNPSADSPFFNQSATHSYSVYNDFNHQQTATKEYVKHTSTYWINEFKVDGFRWDLTKGFTQNCTGSESCTNAYQADRVAVLKEYADAQWAADDDFIIIFEHLGTSQEEKEWASYKADVGKGILLWDKQTDPYNEATMGYSNANFSGISYKNKGFDVPAAVGYMESHDEERLMYKNLAYGNSNGSYSVKEEDTALERMEAAGAFFFTVPGPKMIWQFEELGYDVSIFACEDGSVPTPYGTDTCKLGEKPDGWDYLTDADRMAVYTIWSKLIDLKKYVPIFKTEDFTISASANTGLKTIHLTDTDATSGQIKYVTIIGNFGVTTQTINPQFQETGTWYNLMTDATYEVSNMTAPISLEPGEYKIYGNEMANLGISTATYTNEIKLYPNPANTTFRLSKEVDRLRILDMSGKVIQEFDGAEINGKTVDISPLTSGFYFIQVSRNNDKKIIKLIVE